MIPEGFTPCQRRAAAKAFTTTGHFHQRCLLGRTQGKRRRRIVLEDSSKHFTKIISGSHVMSEVLPYGSPVAPRIYIFIEYASKPRSHEPIGPNYVKRISSTCLYLYRNEAVSRAIACS